jgi:hypothetical protein
MAIDHRIIQQIGVRNNAPALNMFQNTLSQVQNRNIQQQQADQQAELQPFRQQLLEQQVAQGQQQQTQGRQQQILKSVNDFALGNRSLIQNAQSTGDFTGLRNAMLQRREQLIQQGLPTETTDEGIALIDAGQGGQVISALGDSVNLFNQQQGRGKSAVTRDFETKVNLVKNDPELKTPAAKAAAIDLGLEARASSSAQERIALDPVLTDAVAKSAATIEGATSGAREGEKLKQQRKHKPAITALVKLAEKEATERGETITALQRSKAALPGLTDAVDQLKELSSLATSTFGGKVFDFAVKQTGFGSTQGATSRAKFIAIVNNQVLPLLKETFGAAFTATEGESLKATMGDPDAAPEEKMAQLDAFIAQKLRDIETKERQLSQTQDLSTGEFVGFKVIR